MAEDHGEINFPGLQAHWVNHPTDIDDVGCDGMYFEGYLITDFKLWLTYFNMVCRPFIMFSVN